MGWVVDGEGADGGLAGIASLGCRGREGKALGEGVEASAGSMDELRESVPQAWSFQASEETLGWVSRLSKWRGQGAGGLQLRLHHRNHSRRYQLILDNRLSLRVGLLLLSPSLGKMFGDFADSADSTQCDLLVYMKRKTASLLSLHNVPYHCSISRRSLIKSQRPIMKSHSRTPNFWNPSYQNSAQHGHPPTVQRPHSRWRPRRPFHRPPFRLCQMHRSHHPSFQVLQ